MTGSSWRAAKALLAGLIALTVAHPTPADARISIAHRGTPNATLMYGGQPMFKVGPVPERAAFALELGGNRTFDHIDWFDWMKENRLEYGRVYPDHGCPELSGAAEGPVPAEAPGRIFPFEIVRWQDGCPVVDLTRFAPEYWENMARVIHEADRRGIVLQLQLYQRVRFASRDSGWKRNFFNPINNVNKYPVAADRHADTLAGPAGPGAQASTGYDVFEAMVRDTPWRGVHRRWVEHVLDAIGGSGNVIIDLMNEGSFNQGISGEWIDTTLDIIDRWERSTGQRISVGMDFDHLYKEFRRSGDRSRLDFVLAHARLDVLISEGSESHVVPTLAAGHRQPLGEDLARDFRALYRKPIVSTNSPSYGPHENLEKVHLYQWYSLLSKVQGVGVYSKRFPLAFDAEPVSEYARRSRILMQFFDRVDDYAALAPVLDERLQAPGAVRLALVSPREAIVYLHAGIGNEAIGAGTSISLSGLAIRDGEVAIEALNPRSGHLQHRKASIGDGILTMQTPFEAMDIALRIVPGPA